MTRGNTGKASAGPLARRLDRDAVLAAQARIKAMPPSAARSRTLTTIRRQLASIANRVPA